MINRNFVRTLVTLAAFAAPMAARAQLAVLSSTVEEKVASPGSRYVASIVIVNQSSQSQTARIYQTDYTFAADGTSHFDEPGTTARSNARWVAPQSTRIVVPAGSRVNVPYAVSVPADPTLRGSYWSTVMVEGQQTDAAAQGPEAKQVTLGAVMRYAIQVATHIDSTGERTLRFEAPSAGVGQKGGASFELNVINTGERAYRPAVWVELFDADGQVRARARQQRGLLYPGTSLHQAFDLGTLKPGTYKAVVYADTGTEPVFAAQYTITW